MEIHEGLDSIVAFASAISANAGATLQYCGYSIETLVQNATFEEVLYLLWHGRLPTATELATLVQALQSHYALPPAVVALMQRLPTEVHPMEYLRTVVSILAHYDPDRSDHSRAANLRKATRLTAWLPMIVAGLHCIRQGQPLPTPCTDATLPQHFLAMLYGKAPTPEAVQDFTTTLIVHADHEMSAATFAARVTVATLSDIYSGVVSALGTLKGPLHGGANEQVMRTLQAIGSVDNVEPYLHNALKRKERIMGFGHRVYKQGDPRAMLLQPLAKRLGERTGQPQWYAMSLRIQELMEQEKGLVPNVDFYAASVYYALGIPIDLFTPVFVIGRIAGWTAHILEQLQRNRLIRPRIHYVGATDRTWQPLHDR